MAEDTYFELNEDVGLDADGNPEPIVEIGVAIAVPVLKGGEIVDVPQRVSVKAIKSGSRIVKTDNPSVAGALRQHGGLTEIEAPSDAQVRKSASDTKDAREGAANSDSEE
jgi:hypothetical protein